MATGDIKKFVVYSLFLGILILPMVGFPGTSFNAARALTAWGVFVGIFAFWLLSKTIRRSDIYQKAVDDTAPLRNQVFDKFVQLPAKVYIILVLVAVAAYPQLANNYMIDVGITCLIYIVLGLGLNIVVGYAGMLDLGYVAFFAIGSYVTAILTSPELGFFSLTFWQALPFAIILGIFSGVLLGIPVLIAEVQESLQEPSMLVSQRYIGWAFPSRIDRRHQGVEHVDGLFAEPMGLSIEAFLQPSRLADQVRQAPQAPIVLAVDPVAIAHQPVGELLAEHAQHHLRGPLAHHKQGRRGTGEYPQP